jgi:hypothetical protein
MKNNSLKLNNHPNMKQNSFQMKLQKNKISKIIEKRKSNKDMMIKKN